jgi:hypothetical protein
MNAQNRSMVVVLVAISPALISSAALAQQPYEPPRTEHGYPDLQGVWTNATITPLVRPEQYAERRAHTAAETQLLEKGIADYNEVANRPSNPVDHHRSPERQASAAGPERCCTQRRAPQAGHRVGTGRRSGSTSIGRALSDVVRLERRATDAAADVQQQLSNRPKQRHRYDPGRNGP